MASPSTQRIAAIQKKSLTFLLKPRGFAKNGSCYFAQNGDMTSLIDLQKSRWDNENEAQFTVNGGIYIPGVVRAYTGRRDPRKPTIADCSLSVRIGMLEKSRLDKWWKVTSRDGAGDSADGEIVKELHNWVAHLLLPFLEAFQSPADVAGVLCGAKSTITPTFSPLVQSVRHAYASLIYKKLGDSTEAERAFEQALREAKGSPNEKFIMRLRDQVVEGAS